MRPWVGTISLLLIIASTACNSTSRSMDLVIPTPSNTPLIQPVSIIPTHTPMPAPSPTIKPSDLPAPEVTSEGSFNEVPPVELCSPLMIHPLGELPQIIGSPYDPPAPGREERHHGIDFGYYHYEDRDSMRGEGIQSVLLGVVASALEDLYPYGNMVIIETPAEALPLDLIEQIGMGPGESLYILFAHMNVSPLVKLGETVQACQPLGEVGMSGNTDIPHLHLETRIGPPGVVFKSMRFYDTRATQEEMDNYVLWRTSGVFRHFDPMVLLSYNLTNAP